MSHAPVASISLSLSCVLLLLSCLVVFVVTGNGRHTQTHTRTHRERTIQTKGGKQMHSPFLSSLPPSLSVRAHLHRVQWNGEGEERGEEITRGDDRHGSTVRVLSCGGASRSSLHVTGQPMVALPPSRPLPTPPLSLLLRRPGRNCIHTHTTTHTCT